VPGRRRRARAKAASEILPFGVEAQADRRRDGGASIHALMQPSRHGDRQQSPRPKPPSSGCFPDRSRCFPDASGCFPDRSRCFPDASRCFPDASRCFPDASRCFPDASGCFPDASGCFPDRSRCFPDASGCFPGRSGCLPSARASLPRSSTRRRIDTTAGGNLPFSTRGNPSLVTSSAWGSAMAKNETVRLAQEKSERKAPARSGKAGK
jgi:hypothetical protein